MTKRRSQSYDNTSHNSLVPAAWKAASVEGTNVITTGNDYSTYNKRISVFTPDSYNKLAPYGTGG